MQGEKKSSTINKELFEIRYKIVLLTVELRHKNMEATKIIPFLNNVFAKNWQQKVIADTDLHRRSIGQGGTSFYKMYDDLISSQKKKKDKYLPKETENTNSINMHQQWRPSCNR